MTNRERRKQTKRKKRERRLAARKAPPECGWCGQPKVRRPVEFGNPFSGWWTCEPCQKARNLERMQRIASPPPQDIYKEARRIRDTGDA